ncbi:hypothetical protein BC628DRAFT_367665 [Trametes gibbosa]|nr:hypothetical protein BC628DRAFT_367665 [Trametes gibbosa]
MPSPPAVRVIIRLPYNRPEDAPPDPPRVEWTAEKEQILWEVIAKSRAIEGAGTDWKGLASHLQVPLPYILYRAQARYEEDLRGLQGLAIRSAVLPFPAAPSPLRANPTVQGEYFPRFADPTRPPLLHRDSAHARIGSSSSATASASGTVPGTSTLRPLGVRARLSSLGHAHASARLKSPVNTEPAHSPLAGPLPAGGQPPRTTKKISSSSTITLQGPKRTRTPLRSRLSPTSSRPGSSSDGVGDDMSGSDDSDEEQRKADEAERQEMLTRKLQDLQNMMTRDTLGLVADPATRANGTRRGRTRPASNITTSAASLSSSSAPRSSSLSRSHGRQSLSSASVDSRQGSIQSIPSPPADASRHAYAEQRPNGHAHAHTRHLSYSNTHRPPMRSSQSLTTSQSLSQSRSTTHSTSNPHSPPHITSPMPAPPALSPGRAVGRAHVRNLRQAAVGLAAVNAGTGTASEASSFSDLSGERYPC